MAEALKVYVTSNEASARRKIVSYLKLASCEVEVRSPPVYDYVVENYNRR
jgi:hypothetical protein